MSEEGKDRRIQKTHKLLKESLISLILEKGFEAITIQELLDRSNVGRSTFYLHFDNKYELLHSCFEDFVSLLEQHKAGVRYNKKSSPLPNRTDYTLSLFRLVEQNHALFRALLGNEGLTMFQHPLQDYVHTYMINTLKRSASGKELTPLKQEILAQYTTSAFIGTIQWWLNNHMPCSAEEINQSFLQFSMQDISFF